MEKLTGSPESSPLSSVNPDGLTGLLGPAHWDEVEIDPPLDGIVRAAPGCNELVIDALCRVVGGRHTSAEYRPGHMLGISHRGSVVYALPEHHVAMKISPLPDAEGLAARSDDFRASLAVAEGLGYIMAGGDNGGDNNAGDNNSHNPSRCVQYGATHRQAVYVPRTTGPRSFMVQAMSWESGWPSDHLPAHIQEKIPSPDERNRVYRAALVACPAQYNTYGRGRNLSSPVGREVVRPAGDGFVITVLGVHLAA